MARSTKSPKSRITPRSSSTGRGPGRPAKFNRETALETALQTLWKRGYVGASASALSDAMGIERSSFYNTFLGREALFREILKLYGQITPDRPLGQITLGQAVTPVVEKVFRDVCRVRAADPESKGCLMVNSIVMLVGNDPALAPEIVGAVQRQIQVFEALLQQAARQGEIPVPKDMRAAAYTLTIFLIGLNVISKVENKEAVLWASCRHQLSNLGFQIKK
ncbi:MAG: TetR/AcrR family transcriptional regulator [Opitutae bacterium]|nr:TetR/AcrR family transcriptional regulator [Opitutae bacterium]